MQNRTNSIAAANTSGGPPTFNREDMIDFALLGLTIAAVALEPKLEHPDFERLPSAREFIRICHELISELGFADEQ
jgi:hypothetical protein